MMDYPDLGLIVSGEMKVGELLHAFHDIFPNLTLEIYQKGEPVSYEFRNFTLKKLSASKKIKSFSITPSISVAQLESCFWEKLGLQISVFRKIGNSLLETSFTTQWTLEHQNNRGNTIFTEFKTLK